MGSVIRLDPDEGDTHPALGQTGPGRLFSPGYLRDQPAGEYLQDDETAMFALTNQARGVTIERGGDRYHAAPGDDYRTIAVLTDRRIVVLVGDSSTEHVDGDQQLTIPLANVADVEAEVGIRHGRLVVEREEGHVVTVYTGRSGLRSAGKFLEAGVEAWQRVDELLEGVTRTLVSARDHRDAGEYDAADDEARAAYERLQDARGAVESFTDEWGGSALDDRIESVRRRCARIAADVRVERARELAATGESHWRADEFADALDAFERAHSEYESVTTLDDEVLSDPETVREEAARVEDRAETVREAPLRAAVDADKAATGTDDPEDAAEAWTETFEAYRLAVEVDLDDDERRFAGDPDAIRDRLETVVERLLEARRAAATEARTAADWYLGTEQYDVAIEEFETAREHYERALAVAEQCGHDDAEDLAAEIEDVSDGVERARGLRDGEIEKTTEDEEADGSVSLDDLTIPDLDGADGASDEGAAVDDDAPAIAGDDPSVAAEGTASTDDGAVADDGGAVADDVARSVAESDSAPGKADGTPATTVEPGASPSGGDAPAADAGAPTADATGQPVADGVGVASPDATAPDDDAKTVDGGGLVEKIDALEDRGPADEMAALAERDEQEPDRQTVIVSEPSPEDLLRRLDEETFVDLVDRVLSATGWATGRAPAGDAFDLRAKKDGQSVERMVVAVVHRPDGDPVAADVVDACADMVAERPKVDTAMVATSAETTESATARARDRDLRLLDDECLATVVEARGMDDVLP